VRQLVEGALGEEAEGGVLVGDNREEVVGVGLILLHVHLKEGTSLLQGPERLAEKAESCN